MKLEVREVRNVGDLAKERVVIDVERRTDSGWYMLFRAHTDDDSTVDADAEFLVWFRDAQVARGDQIVVWTKRGTNTVKVDDDGNEAFHYYLGRSAPLWPTLTATPMLVEISEFTFLPVHGESDE